MILQLLGIALIFVLIAADSWKQKILPLVSAIVVGFVVNGVRVTLMTILVALSDQSAFIYWHVGNGSLIFSLIAVLIFGLICILLNQPENQGHLNG